MKIAKTNACRFLDKSKIKYSMLTYEVTDKEFIGHGNIHLTEEDPKELYKTLIAVGKSQDHYVFVLPYLGNIDLKKAAAAVREKNMELIHQKDLFPLTGYVRGGCSPLALKKKFVTVFDKSVLNQPFVIFSGGRVGLSLKIKTSDLDKLDIIIKDIILGDVVDENR